METKYNIGLHVNGRSAQNKAIVYGPSAGDINITFTTSAAPIGYADELAWQEVCRVVLPGDRRPVAGRSYIRQCRQKVSRA